MIERFNFYDIYGYLLPGAVLLGFLWLPFGIVNGAWPAAQLAATVFILGFSYVIGHVLQTIAAVVVPSKMRDTSRNMRAPSDRILDPDDKNLSAEVKSQLQKYVDKEFGIDLETAQKSTGADNISLKRVDAFFLCRGLLIRQKIAGYAEQFEGMYSLLRGLSGAFYIGAFYLFGWGCSGFTSKFAKEIVLVICLISGAGLLAENLYAAFQSNKFQSKKEDPWLLGFLLTAVSLGLGMWLGMAGSLYVNHPSGVWIGAFVAAFASIRCYSGYRKFTMLFAKAVWRDFVSFKSQPQDQPKKGTA